MPPVRIKRIYDPPDPADGFRVLVDRVWPRGMSKDRAGVDHWAKNLAPSTDLRKWFAHDPGRWVGFQQRYRQELEPMSADLQALLDRRGDRPLTLLFSARDTERNQAAVLRQVLEEALARG